MPEATSDGDRERLQALHLAVEAALEQLAYAQQIATRGSDLSAPPPEVNAIEKVFGELTTIRNGVRDRLMKALSRPTLNIIK